MGPNSELNLDIPNPFQGRLMSLVDRKRILRSLNTGNKPPRETRSA